MAPIGTQFCPNNRDISCYLVTKHSWKGKYRRVFSIGTLAISTYNPQTLEITNQWSYEDFIGIKPSPKNTAGDTSKQDEFQIFFRSKGKRGDMRFSSEYTADVITECLMFNSKFSDQSLKPVAINAYKHSWSEQRVPVILRASAASLEQVDNRGVVVQQYPYKNIKSIGPIKDCPGGYKLEIGEHRRRHVFASANMEELAKQMRQLAAENIGIVIPVDKEPISLDDFAQTRLGLCSRDDLLTSYVEFNVHKYTCRKEHPLRRILCLSEQCIIERDPASYMVVCATPLKHIICLSRMEKDPQQFVIEYGNGTARRYSSSERDLILASLLDGIRASGNIQVFVSGHSFDRSLRILPHDQLLDEDSESQIMRHIIAPPPGLRRSDMIRRFNANVPHNGLTYSKTHEGFFTEKKEKVIVAALESVLMEVYEKDDAAHIHKCEAQLQCLHRLFASKAGFQAFTEVPGIREKLGSLIVECLKKKNAAIDHSVIEALSALMHPMHDQYEMRTEQLNKKSLLSSPKFIEELLDLVVIHVERGMGWLVISAMLDFLTYAVCAPYSETTEGATFDSIIKMVADRGRSFYRLFHSPSMTIVKGAGMVMRAIIEEADPEISKKMQVLSLTEGAFLFHLHTALLAEGKDLRVLTNKQLSGHLLSLWLTDNLPASELLGRCLPRGLLDFLNSSLTVPVKEADLLVPRNNLEAATQEQRQGVIKEKYNQFRVTAEAGLDRFVQHWDLEQKLNFTLTRRVDDNAQPRPVVLRKRRQRIRSSINWKLFTYEFKQNRTQADLIWNETTRKEFGHAIENEQQLLLSEKERAHTDMRISWNHTEFQVRYPSLEKEIKIGDYFLRVLLQEDNEATTFIHNPLEFFNNIYHRFLLASSLTDMKCQCLKAMGIIYGRHFDAIGLFHDAKHFVQMLQMSKSHLERDHYIFLFSKLVLNKVNVRLLLLAGLLPILVDLCELAHLHTQRAVIQNQSNVIEASAEQIAQGGALEWRYVNDETKEQVGPVSFDTMKELYAEKKVVGKTMVWAHGMVKWQPLNTIPQLKWTICVNNESTGMYNFTELSILCLDILVQMCEFFPSRDEYDSIVRPMPAVKLGLTQDGLLYRVVAMLLTFEPSIVQRVATLLLLVIQDNHHLPSLYLTGMFYFILMYNGSNVLPIAKLLHHTHLKQAFKSALSDDTQQSILSPMLPEAATFFLEHYGPEKYAEVFLGEFDNPETIWNNEMRRYMIQRISVHVADFSCRLTSNVKAAYSFCPIQKIDYPELENELFCHVYYLRHLCDKQRFPDWPIRDPIPFLRSCLAAWYEELDKKQPTMSIEQACEALQLNMETDNWRDRNLIRRAYFKLATKCHPDKLPENLKHKEMEFRETFNNINVAYEFLSNHAHKITNQPDTHRIILCLDAQSIIYSRYKEELSVYKYAGYDRLIKTIDLEAKDDALFQIGGGALLSSAIELCNHTLMSSALNAEQLRRDQGLEALIIAFDRCCPMVNINSKPDDMPVRVCVHICACFATASTFEQCRQRMAELPTLFINIVQLLKFPHLARLSSAAAECVCAMAVCTLLQTQLFQRGTLWQLIPHLFHFDFTLDEGGVQHSEDSNKQSLANRLARSSCEALSCLAGFREQTPDNDGVQNSLRALLTPYVCKLMRTCDNDVVLKALNSNTENPYLIWDNATRAELSEFVETHRNSTENTSDLFGAEFKLSIYAKELIVGDIFVRIYNDQPAFILDEPKKVTMDLLDYMSKYLAELTGQKKVNGDLIDIDWSASANGLASDQKVLMCINALSNILMSHPGVEMLLIGHFSLIVQYMRARLYPGIQIAATKVISIAAGNRECVSDLSNVKPCSTLLLLIVDRKDAISMMLSTLIALSSNTTIVKEILDYGGLMYILSILCDVDGVAKDRLLAAELLAKLQADKMTGPRWTRFIIKYLPPIFADDLRDSPARAIATFDSVTENPELIWNDATRKKIRVLVDEGVQELYMNQSKNSEIKWNATSLADNKCAYSDTVDGEMIVGGVFIRLFLANPGWVVRHPKQFSTELIEKRPTPDLTLVTTAFVELVRHHPSSADQLPAQGYLPQFCNAMSYTDAQASRSAILILQHLADNQFCVDALCQINCIEGIMKSMKNQPTLMRESAHALKCLMKRQCGELASQMLSCGMVEYLLDVLKGTMPGVENASAAKAEIVDALKSASLDLKVGERITAILNASPVWAQYKDQRHDLFLPSTRTHAITGGSSNTPRYLTDTMFNPASMQSQPPPL